MPKANDFLTIDPFAIALEKRSQRMHEKLAEQIARTVNSNEELTDFTFQVPKATVEEFVDLARHQNVDVSRFITFALIELMERIKK